MTLGLRWSVFVFTGGGATSYDWDMGVTDGDPFTAPVVLQPIRSPEQMNLVVKTFSMEATVHQILLLRLLPAKQMFVMALSNL